MDFANIYSFLWAQKGKRQNIRILTYLLIIIIGCLSFKAVDSWKWLSLANIGPVLYDFNANDDLFNSLHSLPTGNRDESLLSDGRSSNSYNDPNLFKPEQRQRITTSPSFLTFSNSKISGPTTSFQSKLKRFPPSSDPYHNYHMKYFLYDHELCTKKRMLIKMDLHKDIQVCHEKTEDIELFDSIRKGASMAIQECQNQFHDRRWNCTLFPVPLKSTKDNGMTKHENLKNNMMNLNTIKQMRFQANNGRFDISETDSPYKGRIVERGLDSMSVTKPENVERKSVLNDDDVVLDNILKSQLKNLGKLLNSGTREAAFVHAISSAGLAYTITRACSQGKLRRCGCDMNVLNHSPQKGPGEGKFNHVPRNVLSAPYSKTLVRTRREKHYHSQSGNQKWVPFQQEFDMFNRIHYNAIQENTRYVKRNPEHSSEIEGDRLTHNPYGPSPLRQHPKTKSTYYSNNHGNIPNDKTSNIYSAMSFSKMEGNQKVPKSKLMPPQPHPSNKHEFVWGGCSDNTAFGIAFAQNFVDTREELNYERKKRKIIDKLQKDGKNLEDTANMMTNNMVPVEPSYQPNSFYERIKAIEYMNTVIYRKKLLEKRIEDLLSKILSNLHNSGAGRKAVERSVKTYCKCHGASGSCELKTCWRSLPPSFSTIGMMLKSKFDGATEVKLKQIGSSINSNLNTLSKNIEIVNNNNNNNNQQNGMNKANMLTDIIYDTVQTLERGRKMLEPVGHDIKPHTKKDLIYIKPSPDFCDPKPKLGFTHGTQGRKCETDPSKLNSCDLLCCGRGYRTTITRTINKMCQCKFQWCCYVTCSQCNETMYENYCL